MLVKTIIQYGTMILLAFVGTVVAATSLAENNTGLPWQQTEFLPADQAFPYQIELNNTHRPELSDKPLQKIQVQWQISEDYYLYQQAFNLNSPTENLKVFGPFFDRIAENKFDPNFDKEMAIFKKELLVNFYIEQAENQETELTLTFQGCAEAGLCYPMQEKLISRTAAPSKPFINTDKTYTSFSEGILPTQQFDRLLHDASLLKIFFLFLILGIGLCLTPCVLPMVPIIASVVLGKDKVVTSRQAFTLSSTYVAAMTITYTFVGVLAASLGAKANLQIWVQHPVVLSIFALMFVLLALAMFDIYELKLPDTLHQKLNQLSQKQKGGSHISAGFMGLLSAVVVSPCISAPLAATLVFISSTGNVAIGATALFALGLGMGLPLIALCTFGINFLPKAGAWLEHSKKFFGLLLLVVAIWMLARFLNPQIILLLWALLAIFAAFSFGSWQTQSNILKTLSLFLLIWGIIMLIGAALGNQNPFKPLENFYPETNSNEAGYSISASIKTSAVQPLPFITIYSYPGLQQQLQMNQGSGKRVLLDIYADWCVACKEIEHEIFENPLFQTDLQNFTLLRADLSANSIENFELLEKLQLFGPPAILFFENNTQELKAYRIQGTIKAEQFRQMLDTLK